MLRPDQQLSFSFSSVLFQKGKPAHEPPSGDEEEDEKSDDNDTMRVSSLLHFIHCNPVIFPCVYNPFLDGRVQRTLLWPSRAKNRRRIPTPT